jgi:hypothetical protein
MKEIESYERHRELMNERIQIHIFGLNMRVYKYGGLRFKS